MPWLAYWIGVMLVGVMYLAWWPWNGWLIVCLAAAYVWHLKWRRPSLVAEAGQPHAVDKPEPADALKALDALAASLNNEDRLARCHQEDRGAFWIGVAFVLAALAFPAYQALLWLQSGVWVPLPLSTAMQWIGWRVPTTDWVGAQKILAWFFDLPVLVFPALAALGSFSAWRDSGSR